MSLGIVRLDADRLPIGGNCLLELAWSLSARRGWNEPRHSPA